MAEFQLEQENTFKNCSWEWKYKHGSDLSWPKFNGSRVKELHDETPMGSVNEQSTLIFLAFIIGTIWNKSRNTKILGKLLLQSPVDNHQSI